MTKIFISYNHQQGKWVWERLAPCLKAGGAEVLIDRERFEVGKAVVGQMDALQGQADKHVLVLSEDYLKSDYCRHEMDRAVDLDPDFQLGTVMPVLRSACELPHAITRPNPLYADLRDDQQPDPWANVLRSCNADLGTTAPTWLTARDVLVDYLGRNQSVNLIVQKGVNWQKLINHITKDYFADLALVDLEDPDTMSRKGLLATISMALGARVALPEKPRGDLAAFKAFLGARPSVARVALTHFDLAPRRRYYDVDLFAALRYFIERNKLVLLVQSHTPFGALLPKDHLLSNINILNVELEVQP